MNSVPKALLDHADSEYNICGIDCNGADFISNKVHSLTHSIAQIHSIY